MLANMMHRVGHDLARATAIASVSAFLSTSTHAQSGRQEVPGYLPKDWAIDILSILPPPPEWGTAALAEDESANRADLQLRGTLRWGLASEDADLSFPNVASTFSCALQAPITQQYTPNLLHLLERTLTDASNATNVAKEHYHRRRPFLINDEPICTPDWQDTLSKNGSYPSGHASIGWTWALLLTEIRPDRSAAVLRRGREFGESRLVCNVHWLSDVVESRLIASATFARLLAEPEFVADLKLAEKELDMVRSQGLLPSRDCAAESAALEVQPERAP